MSSSSTRAQNANNERSHRTKRPASRGGSVAVVGHDSATGAAPIHGFQDAISFNAVRLCVDGDPNPCPSSETQCVISFPDVIR